MAIPATDQPLTAKQFLSLLKQGRAPADLVVEDNVTMRGDIGQNLPDGLTAPALKISSQNLRHLPARLKCRRIQLETPQLETIGDDLSCDVLSIQGAQLDRLPSTIHVGQRLVLNECRNLNSLPSGLRTGTLELNGCVGLKELPEDLDVAFLDATGTSLRSLPSSMTIRGGHLILRDCQWLTRLPDGLGPVSALDVSGCLNLTRLPEDLTITSWIDFAGSGIRQLPDGMEEVGLRWRSIPVTRRIVFRPETLSVEEILTERNAELRRVMMERFGYDRLMEAAQAIEIDADQDAGGPRRLMRVPLEDDEDLVCVFVQCPSTGHRFALRVPPDMETCHQAVAWTAGYDDPKDYKPVQET